MLIYLLISRDDFRIKTIALSLVIGGGIGNLIDRIFNEGRVIDFMNIGIGPVRTRVFNIAVLSLPSGWSGFFSFHAGPQRCRTCIRAHPEMICPCN